MKMYRQVLKISSQPMTTTTTTIVAVTTNLPIQPGECLVPIRVDWEMVKHFNMCQDNLETWHIGPNKVLVAFAPVKIRTSLLPLNSSMLMSENTLHLLSQMMFSLLISLWTKQYRKMTKALNLHHRRILKKPLCSV